MRDGLPGLLEYACLANSGLLDTVMFKQSSTFELARGELVTAAIIERRVPSER